MAGLSSTLAFLGFAYYIMLGFEIAANIVELVPALLVLVSSMSESRKIYRLCD